MDIKFNKTVSRSRSAQIHLYTINSRNTELELTALEYLFGRNENRYNSQLQNYTEALQGEKKAFEKLMKKAVAKIKKEDTRLAMEYYKILRNEEKFGEFQKIEPPICIQKMGKSSIYSFQNELDNHIMPMFEENQKIDIQILETYINDEEIFVKVDLKSNIK